MPFKSLEIRHSNDATLSPARGKRKQIPQFHSHTRTQQARAQTEWQISEIERRKSPFVTL